MGIITWNIRGTVITESVYTEGETELEEGKDLTAPDF